MVDEAIDALLDAAAACPQGSPETDTLCAEPTCLRQMRDQVLDLPPGQRQPIRSHLFALHAREYLAIPSTVLDQVGAVYDLYDQWANHPEWQLKSAPAVPPDTWRATRGQPSEPHAGPASRHQRPAPDTAQSPPGEDGF